VCEVGIVGPILDAGAYFYCLGAKIDGSRLETILLGKNLLAYIPLDGEVIMGQPGLDLLDFANKVLRQSRQLLEKLDPHLAMPVSPSGKRTTCSPTSSDRVRKTLSESGSGMLPTKWAIGRLILFAVIPQLASAPITA